MWRRLHTFLPGSLWISLDVLLVRPVECTLSQSGRNPLQVLAETNLNAGSAIAEHQVLPARCVSTMALAPRPLPWARPHPAVLRFQGRHRYGLELKAIDHPSGWSLCGLSQVVTMMNLGPQDL